MPGCSRPRQQLGQKPAVGYDAASEGWEVASGGQEHAHPGQRQRQASLVTKSCGGMEKELSLGEMGSHCRVLAEE